RVLLSCALACSLMLAAAPRVGPVSFFSWLLAPLDLHSFPTRRSSDLFSRRRAGRRWRRCSRCCTPAASSATTAATKCPAVCTARSEEHTSELQSRENLVCRLLLEKKKDNH